MIRVETCQNLSDMPHSKQPCNSLSRAPWLSSLTPCKMALTRLSLRSGRLTRLLRWALLEVLYRSSASMPNSTLSQSFHGEPQGGFGCLETTSPVTPIATVRGTSYRQHAAVCACTPGERATMVSVFGLIGGMYACR